MSTFPYANATLGEWRKSGLDFEINKVNNVYPETEDSLDFGLYYLTIEYDCTTATDDNYPDNAIVVSYFIEDGEDI